MLGALVACVHDGHDTADAFEHEKTEADHIPVVILIHLVKTRLRLLPVSVTYLDEAVDRNKGNCY